MSDERWLRDALGASVPEPPGTDRIAGIRGRRRRTRRRTALASLGAAAAVAAVALPLALSSPGSRPVDLAAEPTSRPAGLGSPVLDCPPPDARTGGRGTIPDGVVAVRLCPGPGVPFQAPIDALLDDGARKVADTVNEQSVVADPDTRACTMELGRGYLLVFGYADGSTAIARGELYGCRPLTVGDTTREGADAPWGAFIDLLRDQRRTAPPSLTDLIAPTCEAAYSPDGPGLSPIGTPAEIVTGRFCALVGERWVDVPIGERQLDAILRDYRQARPSLTTGTPKCLDQRQWSIAGVTAAGDETRLESWCGWYAGLGEEGVEVGPISPGVRKIVDALLAEATGR